MAAGAATAIVSAVGVLWLFGAPRAVLASIAPRAVTTPVAMAVASQLGGVPSLAAVIVLFAGVVGAMTATPLFDRMKIRDYRARGFAVGVSAHGIGAARAFQVEFDGGGLRRPRHGSERRGDASAVCVSLLKALADRTRGGRQPSAGRRRLQSGSATPDSLPHSAISRSCNSIDAVCGSGARSRRWRKSCR